jgi:hypothetical protein
VGICNEVWNQQIDIEFVDWYFVLSDDLINNSFKKDIIDYSPEIIIPYKVLKRFLNTRIISDKSLLKQING